jgi:hypothetical protein
MEPTSLLRKGTVRHFKPQNFIMDSIIRLLLIETLMLLEIILKFVEIFASLKENANLTPTDLKMAGAGLGKIMVTKSKMEPTLLV